MSRAASSNQTGPGHGPNGPVRDAARGPAPAPAVGLRPAGDRRANRAPRPPVTPPQPLVTHTREQLAQGLAVLRHAGSIALVPTMGALHEGHRALLGAAAERAAAVVVSIFVNPLQFGPQEDLDRYPRTLDADLAMCRDEGVALAFAPTPQTMYQPAAQVTVDPGHLGDKLEGAVRPGHFTGVLTVVAKLFGLVRPDLAVFGEKDYQQLTLIRRMVLDLDLGVQVLAVPTVREPDGLALSSRNRYLSPAERASAATLSRALTAGRAAAPAGSDAVLSAARAVLAERPEVTVDYLALGAPDLGPPRVGEARLLAAVRVGATRLIDNVPLFLGEAGYGDPIRAGSA